MGVKLPTGIVQPTLTRNHRSFIDIKGFTAMSFSRDGCPSFEPLIAATMDRATCAASAVSVMSVIVETSAESQ